MSARVATDNSASRRVLEAVGFSPTGPAQTPPGASRTFEGYRIDLQPPAHEERPNRLGDDRADDAEIDRAETELVSLLHKCEAVLQNNSLSPSRRTLMTNRVAALRTALELVRREQTASARRD